jgi:hypothetical protein
MHFGVPEFEKKEKEKHKTRDIRLTQRNEAKVLVIPGAPTR